LYGGARGEGGGVEGVDGLVVPRPEGDVGAADDGAAAGTDPEVGLRAMLSLAAEPGRRRLDLHQQLHAERRQGRFVESLAALVLADLDPNVIQHGPQLTPATIGR
jgi:hypothetical protein